MNQISLNQEAAAENYAEVAEAIFNYMVDCGFTASHVNPSNLALALEYVYQPWPRFWQDFAIATVVNALSRCVPDWRRAVEKSGASADRLLSDVEEILKTNAFDEANAEMMLSLPATERPTTPSSASEWIRITLAARGLSAQLEFPERDGAHCGENALQVLHHLTQAQLGVPHDRLGTVVARIYRDAAMGQRARSTESLVIHS
ncbi:hypothetical protein FSB08_25160 [Paraburkholderia sp. JPY432]|uniref:hypothetical protein n=1 Tax=Paraburkholderia youngii TaxID=2782701 RepID=UPI001595861D|nr:hypothetical protein [Paraburkholderia youngii]NVH75740.1 hypothetical protein [Paraburkholderia youngii]